MLVDAQGNELEAIRKAMHWRLFEKLLEDRSVSDPLRTTINSHIDAVIADHLPSHEVAIDSTAAAPQVFGRLGASWPTEYNRWHAAMCAQNPEYQSITSERVYGMMLWYVLAADRRERWEVPPQGEKRVYKLLTRQASTPQMSAERRLLIELRESFRSQLARIDELLGNTSIAVESNNREGP
jgi:hypothetical protein